MPNSRNRIRTLILLSVTTSLPACDGFNAYECNGKLVYDDGRPASSVRVLVYPLSPPDWSHAAITSADGTFHIQSIQPTGWVLAWGPPPPDMPRLQLNYQTPETTGTITFDHAPNVKSSAPDSHTRIIDLPPTTIPLRQTP